MSTTARFDPEKHILVVRDATTGKHVHVVWADVLRQLSVAPPTTDLSGIEARITSLEQRPASQSVMPPDPRIGRMEGNIQALASAVADAARTLASHQHDYTLSEEHVRSIVELVAARVLQERAA